MASEEPAQFLEQCLAENGLDDVQVSHSTTAFDDTFYVKKQIGEEYIGYSMSAQTYPSQDEDIYKQIAMQAEQLASKIKEAMTWTYQWNGRVVRACEYEGGWAQCSNCGKRVDMPTIGFSESPELSCPSPLPRNIERAVSNMRDSQRILMRLYLLGRLDRRCSIDCVRRDDRKV